MNHRSFVGSYLTLLAVVLVVGCAEREFRRSEPFMLVGVEYLDKSRDTILIAEDGSRHRAIGILETPPMGTTVVVVTITNDGSPMLYSRIETIPQGESQ